MKVDDLTKEMILDAYQHSKGMGGAAKYLKVDWRTFRTAAEIHGVYSPSKDGRGRANKRTLESIFAGNHPEYPTSHLRLRMIEEGVIEKKCGECGITEWLGQPLSFELDHLDGDNSNHRRENLMLKCPNCHSQTPTYRNKRGLN